MSKKPETENISFYVWCFFICSFIGWIVETIWRSNVRGYFFNAGVLFGPYLPIYGFGFLIIVLVVARIVNKVNQIDICSKHKFVGVILTLVGIFIFAVALEYFSHWLLEVLFDRYWWYYGNSDVYVIGGKKVALHLNGRVSLRSGILLTLAGCVFLYIVYPNLKKLLSKLSQKVMKIGAVFMTCIMLVDAVLSAVKLFGNR